MKRFLLGLFALSAFVSLNNAVAQDADLRKCDLEKMRWHGIPFDRSKKMLPECRPQVLYSWLTGLDVINQGDYKWPLRRGRAWFFRTPLGTAIYANGSAGVSIRVKLKPNTQFVYSDWTGTYQYCQHPAEEKRNSVYVNFNEPTGFSEYMICDDNVIESWSFGMPEHLEEMKREKALIKQLGNKNVDGFLDPNKGASALTGPKANFQGYTIHDARNDGSEATIDRLISVHQDLVKAGAGKVYSMIDGKISTTGTEVDAHFHTLLVLPFHKNSTFKPVPYYSQIKVKEAKANDIDVKAKVAAFCDKKATCTYKMADKFLSVGGPIVTFAPKWTCCDEYSDKCIEKTYSLDLNSNDLENKVFDFGCTARGEKHTANVIEEWTTAKPAKKDEPVKPVAPKKEKVKTGVRIISAKANEKDVTTEVSDFCGGKQVCEYKVAKKFLKLKSDITDLSISWSCVDAVSLKEVVMIESQVTTVKKLKLEEKMFQLRCDEYGTPVFKGLTTEGLLKATEKQI